MQTGQQMYSEITGAPMAVPGRLTERLSLESGFNPDSRLMIDARCPPPLAIESAVLGRRNASLLRLREGRCGPSPPSGEDRRASEGRVDDGRGLAAPKLTACPRVAPLAVTGRAEAARAPVPAVRCGVADSQRLAVRLRMLWCSCSCTPRCLDGDACIQPMLSKSLKGKVLKLPSPYLVEQPRAAMTQRVCFQVQMYANTPALVCPAWCAPDGMPAPPQQGRRLRPRPAWQGYSSQAAPLQAWCLPSCL
jgi:hypothetical protein